MDIKQAKNTTAEQAEQGVPVKIYQPDGELYFAADGKTPSTITVLGAESKKVKRANEANQRRLSRSFQIEPDELLQGRIARATAAIVDWSGWEMDGQPLECTRENVKALLELEHILEQVEAAIRNHAALFQKRSA